MKQQDGTASVWLTRGDYRALWDAWELTAQNPDWLPGMVWEVWDGHNRTEKNVALTAAEVRQVTQWDYYTPWGWGPDPAYIPDGEDPEEQFQLDFHGDVAGTLARHFED